MNPIPTATPDLAPAAAGTAPATSAGAAEELPEDAFALLLGRAAAALAPVDDSDTETAPAQPDLASAAPAAGPAEPVFLFAGVVVQQAELVRVAVEATPADASGIDSVDGSEPLPTSVPVALARDGGPAGAARAPAAPAADAAQESALAPVPLQRQAAAAASALAGASPALRALPEPNGATRATDPAPPVDALAPATRARDLPDHVAAPRDPPTLPPPAAPMPPPEARPRAIEASAALPESAAAPAATGSAPGVAPAITPATHTTAPAAAPTVVAIDTRAFAPGWHEEAAAKLAAVVLRGHGRAELRLAPADLGPVEVRIDLRGGETTIAIVAPQPATRDALEQALPALREALAQQGLALGEATVRDGRADGRQAPERGAFAHDSGPASADPHTPTHAPATHRVPRLVDTFA